MEYSTAATAVLAVLGHSAFLIFVINRIHSTGMPHRLVKLIDVVWYGCLFAAPIAMLAFFWREGPDGLPNSWDGLLHASWSAKYIVLAAAIGPVCIARWLVRRWTLRDTYLMESNHTQTIDTVERLGRAPCGSISSRIAAKLPFNQVFQLGVHEKVIRMPKLDPRLQGLRITHLSDLHFTGRVTKDFYQLIVDVANEWPADLVVISGDIIDKRRCFGWLSEVLGRLQSRHATCFVLGNHDLRIHDEAGLRRELTGLGMIDLGKRQEVLKLNGCDVLLAGNELPWFRPAADLSTAARADFRLAVSHSPDQIGWARKHEMDLMLAGHTHGGQIRFPVIGPIFSPSRYGIRYSAGTFFESPTVLHVSRGLSGTRPLRFNCTPELARLVLKTPR